MVRTADDAFQDLPLDQQHAVTQVRQQIQITSYDRLGADQAREVWTKYQASVADDKRNSVETRPVDRQVSLEPIQRVFRSIGGWRLLSRPRRTTP